MSKLLGAIVPPWMRSYDRTWIVPDVVAGVTLAAVAIPECMGYTSIAQTPVVTGLYTVIFPTLLFVLLGSSRLLVVGADSATAAILAAGLTSAAIPGATPGSSEWLAYTSFIALLCGGLLVTLLEAPSISAELARCQDSWRTVVIEATRAGVPVPGFSSALAYYDMVRAPRTNAAVTQGLRDFFGSHPYRRIDAEGTFHTQWSGDRAEVEAVDTH